MTNQNQHAGRLDYKTVVKLKQMDPEKAEIYKKRKRNEYQKQRVANAIAGYREDYAMSVKENPDNKDVFAQNLREKITQIPMIQEFEEFAGIYKSAKMQLDGLEDLTNTDMDTSEEDNKGSQPGQDEMSADCPEDEATTEEEERTAIDEKINEEESDEEEDTATETQLQDIDNNYIEVFGEAKYNKLPKKRKDNKERMANKVEKELAKKSK